MRSYLEPELDNTALNAREVNPPNTKYSLCVKKIYLKKLASMTISSTVTF